MFFHHLGIYIWLWIDGSKLIQGLILMTAILTLTVVAAIPHSYAYHNAGTHRHPHGRIQLNAYTHHDTDISLGTNLTEVSSAVHVPLNKRSLDNGVQLRILPLGASIVYGLKSSDGNGFRYGLRNQLIYGGNPVNMIGSVTTGTMADGDCEG